MDRIQVEFQPGGQRYTYATDSDVAVGDLVLVPTANPYVGATTGIAKVVAIGSQYAGAVKSVIAVVPPEGKPADSGS